MPKGLVMPPAQLETRRITVERVVARTERIGVTVLSGVNSVVALACLLGGDVGGGGVAVNVGLLGWSLWRVWRPRMGQWWRLADLAVVSVYLLSTPLLVEGTEFTTAASPMLAVGGTAVISFSLATATIRSLGATVVVMASWTVGAAGVDEVGNPLAIFSLDFLLVEWAMAALLRRLVVRAAAATDDGFEQLDRTRIAAEVAEARAKAEREMWATMHDTAASTLTMLGQGVCADPARLRRQLQRDVQAVTAEPVFLTESGTVDVVPLIRAICEDTVTPVRLTAPTSLVLDSTVGQALVSATREALTNVDRHAHARSATVDITDEHVGIGDDGVGFDSSDIEPRRRRHGIRGSMIGRITDIGGTVEIESAPGRGTQVILRWAREDDSAADQPDAFDHSRRLLRGYGYGLVAIAGIVTALQGLRALSADHPVAQLAVMALALATVIAAWIDIRVGLPTLVWWAIVLAVIVAVPIQALLLSPEQLSTGANWAVAALGWQIAALAYTRPRTLSMTLLCALWLIGAVVMLARAPATANIAELVYTIASVLVMQATAIGFTAFLQHAVTRTSQLRAAVTDLQLRTTLTETLRRDHRARHRQLSTTLVPLLHRLANEPDPAADPALRAACVIESARLRRMFGGHDQSGHPLVEELRPVIDAAEHRGVAVALHVSGELPALTAAERTRLLSAPVTLLTAARTRARVVFTGPTPEQPLPTISIVCDCDDTVRATATTIAPNSDITTVEQLTWATFTLDPAPRPLEETTP
ncbi:ATP-binding protein [Nocardia farcinica]|nr:ATP-binding protein [Nocardia farcinica]MBF6382508.1 ATP-binding protein [Nocardia farcinica]MBF6408827.1 ATP-binding protein [Nocardia farcinica]